MTDKKSRNPNTETFTISDLAAQLEMSPSTIRFYEDKGLISPLRSSGNQRIYTKKDRARLKLIMRGKRFGASLQEIAEMIGMADGEINEVSQIEISLSYIENKFREIEEHSKELKLLEEDLQNLKSLLTKRLKNLKQGGM
ncbi:MAG TPA: MerR family transcriptional regulator [Spirochaetota bacterium]|nr:MerR family transcriptional regulator [Spirochaetota bacterium]HPI87738.1 MerR family transcriptional regulator [Spirochaetota bacterium]HPR48137.1 MerR family transcriptional regulator [Spirochaetota bacterium]